MVNAVLKVVNTCVQGVQEGGMDPNVNTMPTVVLARCLMGLHVFLVLFGHMETCTAQKGLLV